MDESVEKPDAITEQHKDLTRKYQLHRTRIEDFWRSFNQQQRIRALEDGAAEGLVLRHPKDPAMGNVFKIIPEINLRDVTEPGSDYLLDHLRHRATKSLHEQYLQGPNGAPGDRDVILNSMRVYNLRHVNAFKYCFTTFLNDGEDYGKSFECPNAAAYTQIMTGLAVSVNAGLVVPQSTGELILLRQQHSLSWLHIIIDDILEIGSTTRDEKEPPRKPKDAAVAFLSKLSLVLKPAQLSLPDVLGSALGHKSALEDYLTLCRIEPVFLAHVVNIWFFSRPELVLDEKGRMLPLLADNYISIAVFEMIHNAVAGAAIWNYICHLLQLLIDKSNDKVIRSLILQELTNVCHLEYTRAQKLFKRMVQINSGSKCFKRIAGVYDNGIARVTMKIKPELMTTRNPQVHYMLRLCQTETDAAEAITWIKKLDDLHKAHPQERDEMNEREWDTFADLVVIASFIQSISDLLRLPPIKAKKGQTYVSRYKALGLELSPLAKKIDLEAFVIPIDNLKEPSMTEAALNALDQFIVENTGTTMGFLYQDLVDDCVTDIQIYAQQHKEKLEQNSKADSKPPLAFEQPSVEVRIAQRREKEKTRPAHSSIYDIIPSVTTQPEPTVEPQIFKVKQPTFETFSTLFSRSTARGAISWTAFEAAMTDLKFSVLPKEGSIYTFIPPPDLEVQRPLTLHRPHKSSIESHLLLRYASRLRRVFGWGEGSFEVA